MPHRAISSAPYGTHTACNDYLASVRGTGVATMGPRGAMAPSLLSYFSIVSMSWFTFAIVSILCCGPLTCFLLATPLVRGVASRKQMRGPQHNMLTIANVNQDIETIGQK